MFLYLHRGRHRLVILSVALAGLLLGVIGCRDSVAPGPSAGIQSRHGHVHVPPHGGTPVILGEEDYHLEFVHIPQTGTLRCYVLDGHMNEFIRLSQPAFTVRANRKGSPGETVLEFEAMATGATGETVGDSSQFEAKAEWLEKSPLAFDGEIPSITVRGIAYENIQFTFPLADE